MFRRHRRLLLIVAVSVTAVGLVAVCLMTFGPEKASWLMAVAAPIATGVFAISRWTGSRRRGLVAAESTHPHETVTAATELPAALNPTATDIPGGEPASPPPGAPTTTAREWTGRLVTTSVSAGRSYVISLNQAVHDIRIRRTSLTSEFHIYLDGQLHKKTDAGTFKGVITLPVDDGDTIRQVTLKRLVTPSSGVKEVAAFFSPMNTYRPIGPWIIAVDGQPLIEG